MTRSILIVDDEFGIADVVAEILAEHGYQVAIAINGQLALASMAQSKPDLVLLDVMMPVMDGGATLERIREHATFGEVPVIMMTALPEALPKHKPPLYQAVLHKPFSETALLSTVERCLAAR